MMFSTRGEMAGLLVAVLLGISGCSAGVGPNVPGANIRYRINQTPGFAVFAVTQKYTWRRFGNPWSDVKYQAVTSDSHGNFTLHTPHKGSSYRVQLLISKSGYRVWFGLLHGDNYYGANMGPDHGFVVKKAASRGQEANAVGSIGNLTGMRVHCHYHATPECRRYKSHLAQRRRYLSSRYRSEPRAKSKWAKIRIASWPKFRSEAIHLLGAVQVSGGLIAALEEYHLSWYYQKYARGQKWHAAGKWSLRNHPEVRRRSHLVLLDAQNRVVFRAPVPGTRHGATHLYKVDDSTLAFLVHKGRIHLFDVKTRKFTRTIQLSAVKKSVRAFAMAPGQGDLYVASQKNLLQRYNALGSLQSTHLVGAVHFISRLRMGAGGACLVHGSSVKGYSHDGSRYGDAWRHGMRSSVVRVQMRAGQYRERVIVTFADAMTVAGDSIWVLRRDLMPARIKALPKTEVRALARSEYERQRLYRYSLDGKLQQTIDVTSPVCRKVSVTALDVNATTALLVYKGVGTLTVLTPPALAVPGTRSPSKSMPR